MEVPNKAIKKERKIHLLKKEKTKQRTKERKKQRNNEQTTHIHTQK